MVFTSVLLCLFVIQSILLVQAGSAGWLSILIPAWLIAVLLSFRFWFHFIDPDLGFNELLSTWADAFARIYLKNSPLFIVRSGSLLREYFLLKNKPWAGILFIYPDSAAAIRTRQDKIQILRSGFHSLKSGDEIILCFEMKYHSFTYGPHADENPFEVKKSGESYTGFHARQLRARKVKAFTKDSREIYPSFQVVYRLEVNRASESESGSLLAVARYLHQLGKTGDAAPILEEVIGKHLNDLWLGQVSLLSSEMLFHQNTLARIMANINQSFAGKDNPPVEEFNQDSEKLKAHKNNQVAGWNLLLIRIYLNRLWTQPQNQRTHESTQP